MNGDRVIADIRRHRGDATRLVRAVQQYAIALGGVTVEWLLCSDQAASVPQENRLGLAEASQAGWGDSIRQRMLDLHHTQKVRGTFWVYSYDNALLSEVRSATLQGVAVRTGHFGELFLKLRSTQFRIAEPRPSGAPSISLVEACDLTKTLLKRGGNISREAALPQKELRPHLVRMHAGATKVAGEPSSETLIRDLIARGRAEGWLASYRQNPNKSGTEMVYLIEATLPEPAVTAQTQSPGQAKADQFELFLTSNRIGAFPRSREILFDAIQEVISKGGYEPLLMSDLLDVSLATAREKAAAAGYEAEKKWEVAGRCIIRLMCRAGVMLDKYSKPIMDRIGRDSQRVGSLSPEFRLVCEAYLAEHIIRSSERFHYDDDTYYLGLTIYRQGSADRLGAGELKEKADALLSYLEQQGRIEMTDGQIIRPQKTPLRVTQ